MSELGSIQRLRFRRKRSVWRRRIQRELSFWRAVIRQLWVRVLVLVTILALGAWAFVAEERMEIGRGVYSTWSLMFGEPVGDYPDSPWLRVIYFVAPALGLIVIVEGLIELALMVRDRRRSERAWCTIMAKAMKDHVILVGMGKLGFRTYQMLRQMGEEILIIESDERNQFIDDVRRDGTPMILGDARRDALLKDANIERAKSIVLATDDDLANLEIALDAKRYNPWITVVLHMFDQNMADKIKSGFQLNMAMSPDALSAPMFAVRALEPDVANCMIVGEQLIVTMRWTVGHHGPLDGLTIGSLMERHHCTIVERKPAGQDAGQLFPGPTVQLVSGDELLVQGTWDNLASVKANLKLGERSSTVAV